jgi:hypothetical protein
MVVVVIGAGVETEVVGGLGAETVVSIGVGVGELPNRLSCARAAAAANNKVQKMMAGRIIDRLNKNPNQSVMKSIFASLIVALFAASVLGKMDTTGRSQNCRSIAQRATAGFILPRV